METTPRQSPRQDASQYARLCYNRERTAKKNETTRKVNYHDRCTYDNPCRTKRNLHCDKEGKWRATNRRDKVWLLASN